MDNPAYYQRRIEEELSAAEQAGDSAIAQIHREMAQRYRKMLNEGVSVAVLMEAPIAGLGTARA